MNMLWMITIESPGYGELEMVLVAAPTEDAARVAAVKNFRAESSAVELLFPEESTAHRIGEADETIEAGSIITYSRAAS